MIGREISAGEDPAFSGSFDSSFADVKPSPSSCVGDLGFIGCGVSVAGSASSGSSDSSFADMKLPSSIEISDDRGDFGEMYKSGGVGAFLLSD